MQHGFIRIAAATPVIRVADCRYNRDQILDLMRKSAAQNAKLTVFPELCLTGYTCADLFLSRTLLQASEDALADLIQESQNLSPVFAVGLPVAYQSQTYSAAAVFQRGRLLGLVPKTNIPNYSEFYEGRHFAPAWSENLTLSFCGQETILGNQLLFECREMPEFCLGVEICEDLWVAQPKSGDLALAGASVIANLSASDEIVTKADYRRLLVQSQSARLMSAYVYADAGSGESTTDLVFAGHDLICENGRLLAESRLFDVGLITADIDLELLWQERRRQNTFGRKSTAGFAKIPFSLPLETLDLQRQVASHPFVPADPKVRDQRCSEIIKLQAQGLRKRLEHIGCLKAIIGLSGGLDSTLALWVTVCAFDLVGLDRSGIIAVTMPGFGTTERTFQNSRNLAEKLGVSLREISIVEAVQQHFKDIGHDAKTQDITYENSQARERTQILMDLANQEKGLVIGTGDLSELALGWATYNGDHMSMYAVNSSIPKTLVRHLIEYAADESPQDLRDVLLDVLATPVSPELLPPQEQEIAQQTEKIVGPYELHDFYLYYFLRYGFTPLKIERLARIAFADTYDLETIRHWLKVFITRFFAQQFKRSCLPDGPKVGSVTLSPRGDWRMPSDAQKDLWLSQLED